MVGHTNAVACCNGNARRLDRLRDDSCGSAHSRPCRAFSRNRRIGSLRVFGVEPDRFDDEVGFIAAVDLARYAIGHSGLDELGFGEVFYAV